MNEAWLILLAYIRNVTGWLRTRFPRKKVQHFIYYEKYLKKGDLVENKQGRQGRICRVYVNIKTLKPVACSVMWEDNKEEKITPFISILDKSPKFNPDIRKIQSKA